MIKRFFKLVIIFSFICLFLSVTNLLADTGVKLLTYTGKIEIININGQATIFSMPQEITEVSANSIVKCIEGVAIFEIGDVKLILEATDSIQFSRNKDSENIEVTCLNGDIQATRGDEKIVFSKDQKLALNLSPASSIEISNDSSASEIQTYQSRAKISSTLFVEPEEEPAELPHASPYQ